MKRLFLIALLPLAVVSPLLATPPTWWEKDATRIVEEAVEPNHYAPANLGQLKHVARRAMYHLEIGLFLQGGANSPIRDLVSGFEPISGESYTTQELEDIMAANYAPANLGQIKAVAKPFYDRLIASGYDTKGNLIARGYPSGWDEIYPWDPETPPGENYAPANLGQLRMVFSFDVGSPVSGTDTDGDGLADDWEIAHGFDPNDGDENNNGIPDGLEDADEDGSSNLEEQLQGRDPNAEALADTGGQLGLKVYTRLEN